MMKKWKLYQRVILISLCVALLSLTLSIFSVSMHYFYLRSTYQTIINEEQNKILSEIEGLTIKEAIEKGYGPQIQLLLKPRATNLSPVSKVEQIHKLETFAWLSGFTAILVIAILLFVYWYLRHKVLKTIKRDMDSVLSQVKGIVASVNLKEQGVILDFIPLIVEAIGYRAVAHWIRQALVSRNDPDNTTQTRKSK